MHKRQKMAQIPEYIMIWAYEQEEEWKKELSNTQQCKAF